MNSPVDYPESHPAGYSPSYTVRNPESDSAGYPASCWADYLPGNGASSGEDCPDSNSADPSADCPDNHPERNPESNPENGGVDNSPDYSEGHSVDSLPDYSASYVSGRGRHPADRHQRGTEIRTRANGDSPRNLRILCPLDPTLTRRMDLISWPTV